MNYKQFKISVPRFVTKHLEHNNNFQAYLLIRGQIKYFPFLTINLIFFHQSTEHH